MITSAMSHPSLNVGVRIFRAGNINVSSLQQLRQLSFRSRRIWASITDPQSVWRKLNAELKESAESWQRLLSSTSLVYSMLPRPKLTCQAAADAMANETLVGIGGYVIFPSGISGWYQLQLHAGDFEGIAAWATIPLQHGICAFELLGQCLLLQLVSKMLGGRRQHCTLVTACDNTASEVAATKGISGSVGISRILPQFFRYQLLYDIFQQVQHIPGYRNHTADALSRFQTHDLNPDHKIDVEWKRFVSPISIFAQPSGVDLTETFEASHPGLKSLCTFHFQFQFMTSMLIASCVPITRFWCGSVCPIGRVSRFSLASFYLTRFGLVCLSLKIISRWKGLSV